MQEDSEDEITVDDGGTLLQQHQLQAITALPQYRDVSFEEMRLKDYSQYHGNNDPHRGMAGGGILLDSGISSNTNTASNSGIYTSTVGEYWAPIDPNNCSPVPHLDQDGRPLYKLAGGWTQVYQLDEYTARQVVAVHRGDVTVVHFARLEEDTLLRRPSCCAVLIEVQLVNGNHLDFHVSYGPSSHMWSLWEGSGQTAHQPAPSGSRSSIEFGCGYPPSGEDLTQLILSRL